ncbi:MAG: class II SORL domain-containing protein [Theionarchaea archaeon]|nr:class II SORL domain-containing protein [Theionarchaea archaeon]
MTLLGEKIQEADWKKEKHVPVIECPDTVKKDEFFEIKVGLGKAIAHPNTTEHHIRWISLYFHPQDEKFTVDITQFTFNAHGESVKGSDTSTIYTHHQGTTWMKTSKPGTLYAMAYCNIHGLWQSVKKITVM